MKCPACDRSTAEKTVGGVTVDVCDGGCGGIWFDRGELARLKEGGEARGDALLDLRKGGGVSVDAERDRVCPRCAGTFLKRYRHDDARKVTIDRCPGCGGVWLDLGELAEIRAAQKDEKTRRLATEEYLAEIFRVELLAQELDDQERTAAEDTVANIYAFVLPCDYFPGQDDLTR